MLKMFTDTVGSADRTAPVDASPGIAGLGVALASIRCCA